MKESYWGYWFVIFGIFIATIMMLTNDATTTNTQDYYQLKEVANSALYDSVDYRYYAQTGQIRILKEVFVENFLRRFAETVSVTDSYTVQFYDLYESPPKVSVKISTTTAGFIIGRDVATDPNDPSSAQTNLDVVNSIDLIVEFDPVELTNCSGFVCENNKSSKEYCDYYPES